MNWATYTSEMRALFFSKNSVVKPQQWSNFFQICFFSFAIFTGEYCSHNCQSRHHSKKWTETIQREGELMSDGEFHVHAHSFDLTQAPWLHLHVHPWKKVVNFLFFFQIMEELTSNGVEIYRFPIDDETVAEMNAGMNVRELINHVPTTLILSNSYLPFTP